MAGLIVPANQDEFDLTGFAYSWGATKFDNYPLPYLAKSFDDFEAIVLNPANASAAKFKTYVAAIFGNDYRRCKDNAMARRYLPFDIDDCLTLAAFAAFQTFFSRWRGFGYTTASHTPDKPRARVVLLLSRPVTREEGQRIGLYLQGMIEQQTADEDGGFTLKFDPRVYQAEQPIFTPVVGFESWSWRTGQPVNVDAIFEVAPQLADKDRKRFNGDYPDFQYDRIELEGLAKADPVLKHLNVMGMIVSDKEKNEGKYSIVCPFEHCHSEGDWPDNDTAYYLPPTGYGPLGTFTCFHTSHGPLVRKDCVKAIGLNAHEVFTQQRLLVPGSEDKIPRVSHEKYAALPQSSQLKPGIPLCTGFIGKVPVWFGAFGAGLSRTGDVGDEVFE